MEAITGRRVLPFGVLRKMMTAENIVIAYQSRKAANGREGGWGKWAQNNPKLDKLLQDVEIELHNAEDD